MATPTLTHYFDITVDVAPPVDLGHTAIGRRLVFNIEGGAFTGPYASGEMLPGGADWQTLRDDGVAELDVRCTMRTDDGVLIGVRSVGIRDAAPEVAARILRGEPVSDDEYYFRTTPRFEVSGERYPELIRRVFIGVGIRLPDTVALRVYAID